MTQRRPKVRELPRKRRSGKATEPVAVSSRLVRDQAAQLQGLAMTRRRSEELARDVTRHVAAISAASARLQPDDEPARLVALLRSLAYGKQVR